MSKISHFNNYYFLKYAYVQYVRSLFNYSGTVRNLQTSRTNNSRTLWTKNPKYSGYYFYMNTNIYRDFQVCISALLKEFTNPTDFNMNDLFHTPNVTIKKYLKLPRKNNETGNQNKRSLNNPVVHCSSSES